MLQLVWAAAAAGVVYAMFSVLAAITIPFYLPTAGFIISALFAIVVSAGLCVLAFMLFTGRLSRMISADRRLVPSLALGIAGLVTIVNLALVWGPSWYVLSAILLLMAEVGGLIASFVLLLQPEAVAWLRAQPGPQPAGPQAPPPADYGQQPPAGPQAPPPADYGQQPPAGPQAPPPADYGQQPPSA